MCSSDLEPGKPAPQAGEQERSAPHRQLPRCGSNEKVAGGQQGGATRYATDRAASATFTFTGRQVAWVTNAGLDRGVARVFVDGVLFGFAGSMAHKPDIGGLAPGSNSGASRELLHDGLMVPPVRFYRDGRVIREIEAIIEANTRTPELVIGDLRGQVGATFLAADRVQRLCARLGRETVLAAAERLFEVTAEQIRAAIRTWPDGEYEGQATLHNDGVEDGRPVHAKVRLRIEGDRIHADFSGASDQTAGPYNIRPDLVRAVTYYVLKCLAGPDLPSNHGLAMVVDTSFREGSVLNPRQPAPVNTYIDRKSTRLNSSH